MENQYTRTEMLLGVSGVEKLKNSHIAVFGLGGVGSFAAEALVRAGVGEITIIDGDTVSLSNINRQLYALHSTVGMNKTDAAAQRIADINPECIIHSISKFCTPENADDFFGAKYDFCVDAIDDTKAKTVIAVKCKALGVPLIALMGTGNKLHPENFVITDIYKTSMCPLCRVMRRNYKAAAINSLTVLYSPEKPSEPEYFPDMREGERRPPASISYVPSCAGLMAAGYVIRSLTGTE